ncbi:MAG: flagellin lysine-N-methylase [Eubacteriales bacterium]|nr:flagellin lysine-N-methylase [Eubacteriales bacterium]
MKVPDYYPQFSCKCGRCRSVCCAGWKIAISETEYFRLLGLECSPELRGKLDASFYLESRRTPERFASAVPDFEGKCRLLGEDGLCSLQKECGESAIPSVCRLYPRSIRRDGKGRFSAVCSGSCEAVTEALMRAEPLHLLEQPVSVEESEINAVAETDEGELYRLMTDRSRPLPRRVLAVGKALGTAEPAVTDAEGTVRALLAFLREFKHENRSVADLLEALGEEDGLIERLPALLTGVGAELPEAEAWLENVLVNHMMYVCFPKGESPEAAFTGLSALCGLMTLAVAAAPHTREGFADTVSEGLRFAEHTAFYHNAEVLLAGRTGGIAELCF